MNEIEEKLKYLESIKIESPRLRGYTFTLKMVLAQDEDYEKKLEYLKSLKTTNEYILGQIDALEWILNLDVPTKRLKK